MTKKITLGVSAFLALLTGMALGVLYAPASATTLLLGLFFCAGLALAALLLRVLRPLRRGAAFARAVSDGDHGARLRLDSHDETQAMADAINILLDTVEELKKAPENAAEQAREARHAKDAFLTRMSHEIRTPMNAIIGLSHLCQQTRLDEQQRQYMNKILAAANGLLNILNELMDFSKAEDGKLELDHLPFHLNAVMDNLARIISPKARAKGLEFVFHMDRNIPPVLLGDPLRLTQVLINLTINAVKFTEQGTVAVTAHGDALEDDRVLLRFSVTDTGIGITQEQLENIFQPFVQTDGSMTRRPRGTGMGLSISQHLVELMGGRMIATNNPEGGSIFSFTVHLKAGEGLEEIPPRSMQDLRALIVDDSSLAQQIIASNVMALGIKADCLDSGAQALEKLTEAEHAGLPYHLVILDWRMPEMDGIETARRICQQTMNTRPPVVLMHSDYDFDELQASTQDAGIAGFLPKPATASAFYEAIRRALGQAKGPQDGPSIQGPVLTGNSRVLLVEDNDINQEIACELLKMAHVDVDVAANGQEAVEAVTRTPYALVFMDVQMPVLDGLEATRRIRAAGHTMPIIAMTAHAARSDRELSLAAGMNDHLTKPLDPEALFTTLNHWLPFASASTTPSSSPRTETRQGTLPKEIEGFNLTAGLAAVGNNTALYADLLNKFATRYASLTEDITASLHRNDLETAVRLAHTVKGLAANLGAESLADAAGKLERTITHDPSMIAPHLKTLVIRLSEAIFAVRAALGCGQPETTLPLTPMATLPVDPSKIESICGRMDAIHRMETDWVTASTAAHDIRDALSGTELEEQAALLTQAVEDFEAQAAAALSRSLHEALHKTNLCLAGSKP